jgi:hypothetical protein
MGVAWILTLAMAAGVLALLGARYFYRGDHDTKDGLELRMPPDADAPVVATTTTQEPVVPPPAPAPQPAAKPEPIVDAAAPVAQVRDASVVALVPVEPRPPVVTNHEPVISPPETGIAAGDAGGTGTSSKEITEQAQKALDDEKAAARAVQLAFLATQEDPTNADAWLTLGAAYLAAGNARQAMQSYKSCVTKAPNHPRVGECKAKAGITD